MLTRKAEEYAAKELKRRLAPRHGLSIWWVILWTPLLWALAALLAASLVLFPKEFASGLETRCFAFAFGVGALLFRFYPCRPVYVLGHELTHWLAAKLTFHRTGKLRLGLRQGSIDIPQPTLFIVLAPYVFPFYLLLSVIVVALARWLAPPFPAAFGPWCAGWLGLCYSYHLVLTVLALMRGQPDLQFRGPVLSFAVIVAGNLLMLYAAVALLTQDWAASWRTPWSIILSLKNLCGVF